MKYGYARVSTDDQNPALQLAALKKAGCKTPVFKDELTGAHVNRPALARCLKTLQPGDTLIVWKLDRLGTSSTCWTTSSGRASSSNPLPRQSTPRRRQAAPCGR